MLAQGCQLPCASLCQDPELRTPCPCTGKTAGTEMGPLHSWRGQRSPGSSAATQPPPRMACALPAWLTLLMMGWHCFPHVSKKTSSTCSTSSHAAWKRYVRPSSTDLGRTEQRVALAGTDPAVIRVPSRPHQGPGRACSELSQACVDSLSHSTTPHLNILHKQAAEPGADAETMPSSSMWGATHSLRRVCKGKQGKWDSSGPENPA